MVNQYIPLHAHLAKGSIGDSILRLKDYVKRAKEYGLDAIAVTDHGSMSAIYTFYDACIEEGIKPIIGMEAYTCEDNTVKDNEHKNYYHLIMLAKNDAGLKNLLRIHNDAADDGFYYKPRTDYAHMKKYGKGIIATSACVGGEIPAAILNGDIDKATALAEMFNDIFDEFYLEIQPGSFEEQVAVNDALVNISMNTGIPLVATNDIHYLNKEDYLVHDCHVKLGRGGKEKAGSQLIYPDTCYWFMNKDTLIDTFTYTDAVTHDIVEQATDNAHVIAGKCKIILSTDINMPVASHDDSYSEAQILTDKCMYALSKIISDKEDKKVYFDRLMHELKVIKDKGFCGYFLIVKDYLDWARKNGIAVGPGRGSAAGSLVNYLLNISQVDPIKHGLLFERFLDPYRHAIPDIDSDLMSARRDDLFRYTAKHFGRNYCARVSTFGIRKSKKALKDSARILGYPVSVGNEITSYIPNAYYDDNDEKQTDLSIETSLKVSEELRKKQKEYPNIFDLAIKLEGLPCSIGLHAAGCIVSPIPMSDRLPLIKSTTDGVLATSLDLNDAEKFFVKFDYLALSSLDLIKSVEEDIGWYFDWQDESLYDDDKTWELISSRNTTGIFQLASKLYKDRMPRLAPRNIDELAADIALVRGPAVSSHTDEIYMQIQEGKRSIEHLDVVYDKITSETNGIILYQEQIYEIAMGYGIERAEAFNLMNKCKKKKMDAVKEYRSIFISYTDKAGVPREAADKIYDAIEKTALYSFNKSHACCYAMVSYCTAYLKANYPKEFMCNLLTSAYSNKREDKYEAILDDCRRLGIKFLRPDINKSKWNFTIEGNYIRIGMCAIKGLGRKAADIAISGRPYASFDSFNEHVPKGEFNKKAFISATFSGLFDDFRSEEESRGDLYERLADIRGIMVEDTFSVGKDSTFSLYDEDYKLEEAILSGQFTSGIITSLKSIGYYSFKTGQIFAADGYVKTVREIRTKNGKLMAFADIVIGDGTLSCVIFNKIYMNIKRVLKKNICCRFTAEKEDDDKCIIKAFTVQPL